MVVIPGGVDDEMGERPAHTWTHELATFLEYLDVKPNCMMSKYAAKHEPIAVSDGRYDFQKRAH